MDDVAQRLSAMEHRLDRLESLLLDLGRKLESRPAEAPQETVEGIKRWVTDFVALRLQQLVPEHGNG